MDTPNSTAQKRCSVCGECKPADTEHFHAHKRHKDGLSTTCKPCAKSRAQSWYHENKERGKATRRAWHETNRETNSAYKSEWKRANRERLAAAAKEWHAQNRESIQVRRKRWYDANADHARQYSQEWAKANPERAKAAQQRYRARRLKAGGTHTAADLEAIRAAQTDKRGRLICWRCGMPIDDRPHLDHWIPLSKGGTDDPGNLHYMHARCNTSKSDKHPTQIGRLL